MKQGSASCRAGGTETGACAVGVVEIVDGQKIHGLNFLNEQLSDAVAFLDEMFAVGVVEQEDFHFTAVLRINHTGAAIDAVLDGHAAARPDESDMTLR